MKTNILKRVLTTFVCTVFSLSCLSIIPVNNWTKSNITAYASQQDDIVNVALGEEGYQEGSNNYTKYGVAYGTPNAEWCAIFIWWCAQQAGIPESIIKKNAWAGDMGGSTGTGNFGGAYYPKSYVINGQFTPSRGDIVYYDGEEVNGSSGHVEIVVDYDSTSNTFTSIGGNTGGGYRVYQHQNQSLSSSGFLAVIGFERPNYDGSIIPPTPRNDEPYAPFPRPAGTVKLGMTGDSVRWVQYTLSHWLKYDIGPDSVDGDFGDATETAVVNFQNSQDLVPDGIVGPATRNAIIAEIDKILPQNDTEAPVISDIQVYDIDKTGYSVRCTVTDNVGVTKVQFPTWTENNGQDDLIWHDASVSGNTYSYRVSVSQHNNEYGRYITHIYAWDAAGNSASAGGADLELKVGSAMTKGAGQTVPDGDYYIFSKLKDNYYLDIDGGDCPAASGTNVHMWTASAGKLPPDCDTWTVKYMDNGFYSITQKGADIGLDVDGASTIMGANVRAWTLNTSSAQLWSITSTDTGYKLQAKCSGYCLDVAGAKTADDTNVQVWESNDKSCQRWELVPLQKAPLTSTLESSRISVRTGEAITFTAKSDSATAYTLSVAMENGEAVTHKMTDGKLMLSFTEAGSYTAYVTASNSRGSKDSKKITFSVTPYEVTLYETAKHTISAYGTGLTYKSSNKEVAIVSTKGVITAMGIGNAVITVADANGKQFVILVQVKEKVVAGDCNDDGEFNVADVVLLQRWLRAAPDAAIENWSAADLNSDGRVNVFDLIRLKRMLFGSGYGDDAETEM